MRTGCKSALFSALCTMMVGAGCSGDNSRGSQSDSKVAGNHASPPARAAAPDATAPVPAPQKMAAKVDGFEFSYTWPGAAAAIPALNDWLRGNGAKLRDENRAAAMEAKAEAKRDGFPFNGYSYQEDYTTVADTPRILALLSEGYVYTGGAHGMPVTTAILWDKAAHKRLPVASLIDIPRLATLSRKRFCDALDRQRAEKRGAPVRRDDPDELSDFVTCVAMTDQLILPISRDGKALDTVRVVIAPYNAGPYAEGSYVIDLPIDATVIASVKPAYRDAFAKAR